MTGKEIVQALRCCKFGEPCNRCPVVSDQNCVNVMHKRAADLIERLTAENAALREKVPQWISVEDRLPEAWKNEEDNTLFIARTLALILAIITKRPGRGCAWPCRAPSPTGCRCRKRRRKETRHEQSCFDQHSP